MNRCPRLSYVLSEWAELVFCVLLAGGHVQP